MMMLLKRAGYLSTLIALCICAILTGNHLFALLADAGVYHRIAWINRETGIMEMRSIASTDDLYGEQGALLSDSSPAFRISRRSNTAIC